MSKDRPYKPGIIFPLFITGIMLAVLIAVVSLIMDWNKFYKTAQEKFEDAFGIELPPSTVVVDEKSDRDLHGDGLYFYTYKIDENKMEEFVSRPGFEKWGKLPVPQYFAKIIINSIDYSFLGQTACAVIVYVKNGFFYYYERPVPGYGGNYNGKVSVFRVGIVDMDRSCVFFLDVDLI